VTEYRSLFENLYMTNHKLRLQNGKMTAQPMLHRHSITNSPLYRLKTPLQSNGVFDSRSIRQISMQAWLFSSLFEEIKQSS